MFARTIRAIEKKKGKEDSYDLSSLCTLTIENATFQSCRRPDDFRRPASVSFISLSIPVDVLHGEKEIPTRGSFSMAMA
jgi:hypothetical protein